VTPEELVKNGRTSWTFSRSSTDEAKIRGKGREEVSGGDSEYEEIESVG
jgi:hypothetical protein